MAWVASTMVVALRPSQYNFCNQRRKESPNDETQSRCQVSWHVGIAGADRLAKLASIPRPLMRFTVQIESPLIVAMEEQLPWASTWEVFEGIATMAWDARSRLTGVHRLGHSIAQVEVLTPSLGFNIHMLSDGTMIYATMEPMMSYDDWPLTEAQLGLVEH